jgi:hypothetical protein
MRRARGNVVPRSPVKSFQASMHFSDAAISTPRPATTASAGSQRGPPPQASCFENL